jgi:WD40 repeat protein
MDRNEGIIRWSPNTTRDEFMHINLNHRIVQVYAATGHARPGYFEFEKLSKHSEFSHLNTYDWSPASRGLVAIGTAHGEVQILRIDDDSNACLTLPLKLQRSCQTVAFNTTGLLAVGLDRVRNDACLQIWDVNQRLADWDTKKSGFTSLSSTPDFAPYKRLEASVSVTSIRFYEDQPQTLVAGIKNQCVRIHDLRGTFN